MANTELRRRLEELARQFVDGVLGAVSAGSISEVADAVSGSRANASSSPLGALRGTASRPSAARESTVSSSVPASRRAVVMAPAPSAGRKAARKLERRDSGEIERIRSGILRVLGKASAPVGAAHIAREIGDVDSAALAFPMAKLRDAGLVSKEGERTQAVYALTKSNGKKGDAGHGKGKKNGKKK